MSGEELIRLAYFIWILAVASGIFCLVFDFNHARQIRKWLRDDYGEECCARLRNDGRRSRGRIPIRNAKRDLREEDQKEP